MRSEGPATRLASLAWGQQAIPFFYGYDEQMKVTEAFLKDALAIDIFALSKNDSGKEKLIAPLDRANFRPDGPENRDGPTW